jgi:hypothetical protein
MMTMVMMAATRLLWRSQRLPCAGDVVIVQVLAGFD